MSDPALNDAFASRAVSFNGGGAGEWEVTRVDVVSGPPLPAAARVGVVTGRAALGARPDAAWSLRGVTGHTRYVERPEKETLATKQAGLGRPAATRAALIPISKSEAWWSLAQDERRAIFENRSRHIADSLSYLPDIARQLYHCRDLGEPFDFLTWFEFAPQHEGRFDELVAHLRASEEWAYVTREIDIRLTRAPA